MDVLERRRGGMLWADSDSSSEDEQEPRRRKAARNFRRRIDHFARWSEEEFRERFRLSKNNVRFLEERIGEDIDPRTNRNQPISASMQRLIFLRFCATGCILQSVGDFLGIHRVTAGQIISRLARKIAELSPEYIYLPRTAAERDRTTTKFFGISRFPRVMGAIDCTHVKIASPGGHNAENFRNRKQYFSLNVQAVSDSALFIRSIVARWPGSTHDQTIFNNSRLKARFENREFGNSVLLGDSGYALQRYLITPLLNPNTNAEKLFNESQIRSRNPVERLFGVWKKRFPVLSLGMRTSVRCSQNIIIACAVLHNIARLANDPDFEENDQNDDTDEDDDNDEIGNVNHRSDFLLYFFRLLGQTVNNVLTE